MSASIFMLSVSTSGGAVVAFLTSLLVLDWIFLDLDFSIITFFFELSIRGLPN